MSGNFSLRRDLVPNLSSVEVFLLSVLGVLMVILLGHLIVCKCASLRHRKICLHALRYGKWSPRREGETLILTHSECTLRIYCPREAAMEVQLDYSHPLNKGENDHGTYTLGRGWMYDRAIYRDIREKLTSEDGLIQ
jgi:hypothetical protein